MKEETGDRTREKRLWCALSLCVIANVICAALFGAALWLMQQPQVFVGVLLFTAVAAVASLAAHRSSARD